MAVTDSGVTTTSMPRCKLCLIEKRLFISEVFAKQKASSASYILDMIDQLQVEAQYSLILHG